MVTAFSIFIFVWLLGAPELDKVLGNQHDPKELWFDPAEVKWNPNLARVWKSGTLIALVWIAYAAAAVISRYCERAFRDRVLSRQDTAAAPDTVIESFLPPSQSP
jgi:hypothetical protein